jgi:hypothetical protein
MGKQYTFKSTKATSWLEPLLDGMGKERSEFIREMIIAGMQARGLTDRPPSPSATQFNVLPTSVQREYVTQLSDKRCDNMSDQLSDKRCDKTSDTFQLSRSKDVGNLPEPIMEEMGVPDISLDDLESRLDGMYD